MKNELINDQFQNIKSSSTLEINEISNNLLKEGKDIFKFGLGQSPFPIPKIIVEELQKNAFQKDYLNVSGLLKLREVVAKYHSNKNKYNYISDNIIIGPGSKELLFQCQMVIKGCLLLPSPSWVSYQPQAHFLKKKIHWIQSDKENNWHITAEKLNQHCLDNTNVNKLLILNSPNNPSGTNISDLENISQICRKFNIIVISDEIYAELNFSGNYNSISHFYPEGTIISSGLSKWCGAGGWRLGTLIFPSELSDVCQKIKALASETYSSVSAPIQFAAIKAYSNDHSDYLRKSRIILKTISLYIFKEFSSIGIECVKPEGGFYMLCDFSKIIKKTNKIYNASSLCGKLLSDVGFAMLPGKNFGLSDESFITRIAYVDFDGQKALSYLDNHKNINSNDFNYLFPKIYQGVKELKNWLKFQNN